jgi:hypothetical protein
VERGEWYAARGWSWLFLTIASCVLGDVQAAAGRSVAEMRAMCCIVEEHVCHVKETLDLFVAMKNLDVCDIKQAVLLCLGCHELAQDHDFDAEYDLPAAAPHHLAAHELRSTTQIQNLPHRDLARSHGPIHFEALLSRLGHSYRDHKTEAVIDVMHLLRKCLDACWRHHSCWRHQKTDALDHVLCLYRMRRGHCASCPPYGSRVRVETHHGSPTEFGSRCVRGCGRLCAASYNHCEAS